MRRIVVMLVVLVVSSGLLASPATAGSPPVTLPSSPKGLKAPVDLPDGTDPVSPYLPQVSCSPIDLPGVVKLRDLVLKTYGEGGSGAIHHDCTEGLSEHSEGRAWDWMVNVKDKKEKAAAASFISWVTRNHGRNARRLGIMYVIYNKKIWAAYRQGDGWRKSYGHTDHVHISLSWNGARGNTSFWTGKVGAIDYGPCIRFNGTHGARTSTPRAGSCPGSSGLVKKTSRADRQYGRTGATVKKAQKMLKIKATGRFDSATWSAVRAYQREHDIPYTGVLDQPTWASLDPGSIKSRAVHGYSQTKAIAYGLKHYSSSTIKRRQVGKAVVFLQTALHLPVADRNGFYDFVTLAAVKKVQTDADLRADGVVKREEWQAMQGALD